MPSAFSMTMMTVSLLAFTGLLLFCGRFADCSCHPEGSKSTSGILNVFSSGTHNGGLRWVQGRKSAAPEDLPPDFNWRAYLKWNPELEMQGIHTREAAEQHYVSKGHLKGLVYRDFELAIRYTACGGLMNQHYCHMATLALAHMAKADKIIWPPMQERKSFHIRYHPDATQNEQQWTYLDATSLWDLPKIQRAVRRALFIQYLLVGVMSKSNMQLCNMHSFSYEEASRALIDLSFQREDSIELRKPAGQLGIKIVKHPDDVPMPDMTKLETAFQAYDPDENWNDSPYDFKLRLNKPIYLGRHNPHMLARAIMDAGRQVVLKHGRQPTSVVVDLPCTLFMLDNRHLPIIEDIARLMYFSPRVMALADKVVKGIAREEDVQVFNGVHLRMERDAIDWANILGGKKRYWNTYMDAMRQAKFSKDTPLYVASGLLTGSSDINDPTKTSGDPESIKEMKSLVKDMLKNGLASKVVHKEMYLDEKELADLSKEQSGLIDFLVLRWSQYMVGISVSTFSFYLQELRLLDGHAQEDTVMYDAHVIGTDEMFYTAAVVATETREEMSHLGVLYNTCWKRNGKPCSIEHTL